MADPSTLKSYCKPTLQSKRKGRSGKRLLNRDEKIAARFYYYAHLRNLNYSKIIAQLAEEFDIDESVVSFRLRARQDIVDKLFANKPGISTLRRKYLYYAW